MNRITSFRVLSTMQYAFYLAVSGFVCADHDFETLILIDNAFECHIAAHKYFIVLFSCSLSADCSVRLLDMLCCRYVQCQRVMNLLSELISKAIKNVQQIRYQQCTEIQNLFRSFLCSFVTFFVVSVWISESELSSCPTAGKCNFVKHKDSSFSWSPRHSCLVAASSQGPSSQLYKHTPLFTPTPGICGFLIGQRV